MLRPIKPTEAEIEAYRAEFRGLEAEGYTASALEEDCTALVFKYFRETESLKKIPAIPLALRFVLGHPDSLVQWRAFSSIAFAISPVADLLEIFVRHQKPSDSLSLLEATGLALLEYATNRLPEPRARIDGAAPASVLYLLERTTDVETNTSKSETLEEGLAKRDDEIIKGQYPGNLAKWDAAISSYYQDNASADIFQGFLKKLGTGELRSGKYFYEKFLRNTPLIEEIISERQLNLSDIEALCGNAHMQKMPEYLKALAETLVGLLYSADASYIPGREVRALLAQYAPADRSLCSSDKLRFLARIRSQEGGVGLLYVPSFASDPLTAEEIIPLRAGAISTDRAIILLSQLSGANWLGAVKRIIQTEANFEDKSKAALLARVVKGATAKNLAGLGPKDFAPILASTDKGVREAVLKKLKTLAGGARAGRPKAVRKMGGSGRRDFRLQLSLNA